MLQSAPMLTAEKFVGNIPPLVTPVCTVLATKERIVDIVSQSKLINWSIKGRVGGIFLLGTAGESPTIPNDQFDVAVKNGIETVRKSKKPETPVLVGISANNIDEMIRRAKFAEKIGADALVLVPLFGEGLPKEKLEALIKEVKLPIVLYDNPGIHTGDSKGVDLDLEFVKNAKKNYEGRVIGIKITSTNKQMFEDCLRLQDETFHVLQGGANPETLNMEVDGQRVSGVVSFEAVIAPLLINLLIKYPDNKLLIYMVSKLGKLAENPKKVKETLKAMGILATALMFKD